MNELFCKEFDEPLSLLENTGSMFHSLVEQTGPIAATQLKSLAEEVSIMILHVNIDPFLN